MLKSILETIRKPKATAADLRQALSHLSVQTTERVALDLEQERRRLLLDGSDAEVKAVDAKISAAYLEVERTAAAIEDLTRRLAEAEQQEQEVERRRQYDEARRLSAAAQKSVPAKYRQVTKLVYDLLCELGEAQVAVNRANDALPAGAEPLVDPEMVIRGLPAEPRKDIKVTEAEAWCYAGSDREVQEVFRRQIKADETSRCGTLQTHHNGFRRGERVVLRKKRRIEFVERVPAYIPDPLSLEIHLPGLLPGEPPVWAGVGRSVVYDARLGVFAEQVLSTIAEIERSPSKPCDPRIGQLPQTRFEYDDEPRAHSPENGAADAF